MHASKYMYAYMTVCTNRRADDEGFQVRRVAGFDIPYKVRHSTTHIIALRIHCSLVGISLD